MILETVGSQDFQRDGHGRPLIVMPGTGEILPHSRVSTVAKLATNMQALMDWAIRQTGLAVSRCPDIIGILSGLSDDDPDDRRQITQLIDESRKRHGGSVAANWGTAVHLHTEHDADRAYLPSFLREDVESYDRELERTGIVPIESELRIANSAPDLMVAGTCDHLYRIPDGVCAFGIDLSGAVIIGDKKTSAGRIRSINVAAQLAGYSYGDRYDPTTDERTDLHPDICREVGLGVHIPKQRGVTAFHFIDLRKGRELLAAAEVLHRLAPGRGLTQEVPDKGGDVTAALAACLNRDDLMSLWRSLGNDQRPRYRDRFIARQKELS